MSDCLGLLLGCIAFCWFCRCIVGLVLVWISGIAVAGLFRIVCVSVLCVLLLLASCGLGTLFAGFGDVVWAIVALGG